MDDNGLNRVPVSQFLGRLLAVVLGFIMVLAWMASLGAASLSLPQQSIFAIIGALASVILPGGLLLGWAMRIRSEASARTFFYFVLVLGLILRILLVWRFHGYVQTADRSFFHHIVQGLCAGGLNPENTVRLAESCYDFRTWFSRSLPIQLWLSWLLPGRDVLATQIINILFSTAMLWPVWMLARRFLDLRGAVIAFALYALIPFNYWQVLEYSYESPAVFFFISAFALMGKLWDQIRSEGRLSGYTLLLALCLALASFQGSLDTLYLGVVAAYLAIRWLTDRIDEGPLFKFILLAWLVPFAGLFGVKSVVSHYHQKLDPTPINSGASAFMARGWSLAELGEYDAHYEIMDRITPEDSRRITMQRLVLSTLRYEPLATLAVLFPAKAAKYYLVGFASNVETGLVEAGEEGAALFFRSTRQLFAPLFLLMVMSGCVRAVCRRDGIQLDLMPVIVLLCFCGAAVLFGETSPRYSFYVTPFMALVAASGMAPTWSGAISAANVRSHLSRLAFFSVKAAAIYLFSCAILYAFSFMPGLPTSFADLRKTESIQLQQDEWMHRSSSGSEVVTRDLVLPSSGIEAIQDRMCLPVKSSARRLSFFLWPYSYPMNPAHEARLEVRVGDQDPVVFPLAELVSMKRMEFPLTSAGDAACISVRLTSTSMTQRDHGVVTALKWGYVAVD